jgi:hypothetical protein
MCLHVLSDISNSAAPTQPTQAPAAASGAAGEEDFDMFAQSRQSFDQSKTTKGGYVSLLFCQMFHHV